MDINQTLENSRFYRVIQEVLAEEKAKEEKEFKETVKEVKQSIPDRWDVKIGEPIHFFDANLSYEITGYRPIDGTRGLDFDPTWFTEAKETKEKTGKYYDGPKGSKGYREFWNEQYRRCRHGMTVNGYTITGDHYYFLNFYRLLNVHKVTKAGGGRTEDFADFYVKQYEYFHYIELCKVLRKDAIGLKARGVGFSEIAAAIAVNTYNCRSGSMCVIAAQQDNYLNKTLSKVWT